LGVLSERAALGAIYICVDYGSATALGSLADALLPNNNVNPKKATIRAISQGGTWYGRCCGLGQEA
jgi:Na+/H+ antiporter NhaC